jgi:hypothetical protein
MKISTIILMLLFIACNYRNRHEKLVSQKTEFILTKDSIANDTINQLTELNFKLAHNLKSKDGLELGSIFIKPLIDNEEVFLSLIIIKENVNGKDSIYNINGSTFSNKKGIDITVYDKDLYGYRFVSKKDDSFILQALHNKGNSVSDNIWIKWNEDKSIFEVEKAP